MSDALINRLRSEAEENFLLRSFLTEAADALSKVSAWQPMETAPLRATWVALLTKQKDGRVMRYVAHFAEGGGEDQPRFGPGWFYDSGSSGYYEVHGTPLGWLPLPDVKP